MVYTLRFFFSSKCILFHNFNVFGSCIIHILYTGCAKIEKIIPAPKGQTRVENVEYSSCFGNMVRNVASCTRDIKSRNAVAKAEFNHHEISFRQQIGLTFKEETSKLRGPVAQSV